MALEIISSINVDMKRPNAAIVHAVQYNSTGTIKIQLLDDGEKWYVPSGVTSAIFFKKSDRIGGYYDKLTINNQAAISFDGSDRSIVYAQLDVQTTTTAGNVSMQVSFFEGNKRLTSFSFLLKVQQSPLSFADITSQWLFNVLAEANLVVDNTLKISSAAADAKVTGEKITNINKRIADITNSCNLKVNKPMDRPNGVAGQLLRTNGDGTTTWVAAGLPTDAQVAAAVTNWLNDHPEATTTVQDGSIELIKMHPNLRPLLDVVEVTS